MRGRPFGRFFRDEGAGTTVEFVAIFGPFLLVTFFIMEVVIAVFWIGSAEKAAQLGARLAIVSNRAVTGLPATNTLRPGGAFAYGQPCSTDPTVSACGAGGLGFSTATCVHGSGGVCDTTNFNAIVSRMKNVLPLVQAQYVTITYSYGGLGFAGGPIVPSVTVKVSGVPYGTVFITLLANFFAAGNNASPSIVKLPDISVTLTGEDLSSAGA